MKEWVDEFGTYRISVTEARIDRWLGQFDGGDRDVAARVLDSVHFVSYEQVTAAFRAILASLNGWSSDAAQRTGRWLFVPFSGSAGESGDLMLERFRHANNLKGKRHDGLFCYRSELMRLQPGKDDTVVLVDDFSGTGEQACTAWREVFQELLPNRPRVLLVLLAASKTAIKRIEEETDMEACTHLQLTPKDYLFSDKCNHFTGQEKAKVHDYGEIAAPNTPRGRGDCGFVIVFYHGCPNNTVPILHARRRRKWEGLFRRYD